MTHELLKLCRDIKILKKNIYYFLDRRSFKVSNYFKPKFYCVHVYRIFKAKYVSSFCLNIFEFLKYYFFFPCTFYWVLIWKSNEFVKISSLLGFSRVHCHKDNNKPGFKMPTGPCASKLNKYWISLSWSKPFLKKKTIVDSD